MSQNVKTESDKTSEEKGDKQTWINSILPTKFRTNKKTILLQAKMPSATRLASPNIAPGRIGPVEPSTSSSDTSFVTDTKKSLNEGQTTTRPKMYAVNESVQEKNTTNVLFTSKTDFHKEVPERRASGISLNVVQSSFISDITSVVSHIEIISNSQRPKKDKSTSTLSIECSSTTSFNGLQVSEKNQEVSSSSSTSSFLDIPIGYLVETNVKPEPDATLLHETPSDVGFEANRRTTDQKMSFNSVVDEEVIKESKYDPPGLSPITKARRDKKKDDKKEKKEENERAKKEEKEEGNKDKREERKKEETAEKQEAKKKDEIQKAENKQIEVSAKYRTPVSADPEKSSILDEYAQVIETIKLQNQSLAKIKRDLQQISPSERVLMEKMYTIEEDKLNEELLKAMIIQSRCPYEQWDPIPVAPSFIDDTNFVQPTFLINNIRQKLEFFKVRPERKSAGEENDLKKSSQSALNKANQEGEFIFETNSETEYRFKKLLDSISGMDQDNVEYRNLNSQIVRLLKKRRKIMDEFKKHSNPEYFQRLEKIDYKLSKLCELKLSILSQHEPQNENVNHSPNKDEDLAKLQSDIPTPKLVLHLNVDADNSKDQQSSYEISEQKRQYNSLRNSIKRDLVSQQNYTKSQTEPGQSPETKSNRNKKVGRPEKRENSERFSGGNQICNEDSNLSESSSWSTNDNLLTFFENITSELRNAKKCCCTIKKPNKDFCNHQKTNGDDEIKSLKEEIKKLERERDEYKVILKEQAEHMDECCQMYKAEKQTVKLQACKIAQMENKEAFIQEQICEELEKLGQKFDKKLKSVQMLLEQERCKVKHCCMEKKELEEKIYCLTEKLEEANNKTTSADEDKNLEVETLKSNLQAAQEMLEKSQKCNACLREELERLREELKSLRKETDCTLYRAKEKFKKQNCNSMKKIKELEEELLKERVKTCNAQTEIEKRSKQLQQVKCTCENSQARVKCLQNYIKGLLDQLNGPTSTNPCMNGRKMV